MPCAVVTRPECFRSRPGFLLNLPFTPAKGSNDAFLLAMSLAGEADYLVTGDRRAGPLQRGSIGRTRIITPASFCAEAL